VKQQIENLKTKGLSEEDQKAQEATLESQLSSLETEYLQAVEDENSSSSSSSSGNGNTSTTAYGAAG